MLDILCGTGMCVPCPVVCVGGTFDGFESVGCDTAMERPDIGNRMD